MRCFKSLFFIGSLTFVFSSVSGASLSPIEKHFSSAKKSPQALYTFLKAMPKGGDLHNHLAGATYAENLLKSLGKKSFCIDKKTLTAVPKKACGNGVPITALADHPSLYQRVLQKWSFQNAALSSESAHDHFFESFFHFIEGYYAARAQALAEVCVRAAQHHLAYLELMIMPDEAKSISLAPEHFSENYAKDLKNIDARKLQRLVKKTQETVSKLLAEKNRLLHCKTANASPGCSVDIRFQYHILREQSLAGFFAQTAFAFALAQSDPRIVGINLVQAEDGPKSLQHYHDQMKIFAFFKKRYPKIPLSLHAGELTEQVAAPDELSHHIREAVTLANASRIGHGIDIAFENKPEELVRFMAKKSIPVEINLTSNQIILGIEKSQHPFLYYLSRGVPLVISTDDEGVLRTDITREYQKAVLDFNLNYQTLKQLNRNSLTYSFLPGESLWKNPRTHTPVAVCLSALERPGTKPSRSCQRFLKKNVKAAKQWELENALSTFEKNRIEGGYDATTTS